MVLRRRRTLRIPSVPYLWATSLETIVMSITFCHCPIYSVSAVEMHPRVQCLTLPNFHGQIFLRLQPHVCWRRDDLFAPRQPFYPLWSRSFLGRNVAAHEETGGELVLCKCVCEQHDRPVRLQGISSESISSDQG